MNRASFSRGNSKGVQTHFSFCFFFFVFHFIVADTPLPFLRETDGFDGKYARRRKQQRIHQKLEKSEQRRRGVSFFVFLQYSQIGSLEKRPALDQF